MLLKFFALVALLFIFRFWLGFTRAWRFLSRSYHVKSMFSKFNSFLKAKPSKRITYILENGVYIITFSNMEEAYMEFERIINDAFKCYDKLGIMDNEKFEKERQDLTDIRLKITRLEWKE